MAQRSKTINPYALKTNAIRLRVPLFERWVRRFAR